MAEVILSPCLYMKESKLHNLGELLEVLEFAQKYLDVSLSIADTSILHVNNWYKISKSNTTVFSIFNAKIIPLLGRLQIHYVNTSVTEAVIDFHNIDNYVIVDLDEFISVLQCLLSTKTESLMFVGTTNASLSEHLRLNINDEDYELLVVKDVWRELSCNYNACLKTSNAVSDAVFPYKEVCARLHETLPVNPKESDYKALAKVIALRNEYTSIPYKDTQYKKVPYYMSRSGEHIICVDAMHGTFEVFKRQGNGHYENYIGEYNYRCEYIENKRSVAQTHKCYKSY